MRKFIGRLGMLATVVGVCGMDSASQLIPVALIAAGVVLTYIGGEFKDAFTDVD